ncbi:MAG TPA: SRPBCC domain-containing protein [Streptosporangiaceae bacterium]|nr:SRPBCC domain-containing protein [Streptosporangiaceae bacterium]
MSHSGEISVSRVFDAPRELVYQAFVDPDQLGQWFGPAGFSMPFETVHSDVRTGGFQRFVLVNDADPSRRTPVDVALGEVVEDELLVAHADIGPVAGTGRTARIRLRLEFLDQPGGRTRLELRQDLFRDDICGDQEATWESSFTRLDSLLRRSL